MSEQAPILFMETGAPCSTPAGFRNILLKTYGATIHGKEGIRNAVRRDHPSVSASRQAYLVNQEADRRVVRSLSKGFNVFNDGLPNSWARREEIRQRVFAEVAGVVPVLLCVRAPLDIIEQRVEASYKRTISTGKKPTMRVEKYMIIVNATLDKIEWPDEVLKGEEYLSLDGSRSPEQLLADVQEHLAQLAIGAPATLHPAARR